MTPVEKLVSRKQGRCDSVPELSDQRRNGLALSMHWEGGLLG
jgi:hypothetical protein